MVRPEGEAVAMRLTAAVKVTEFLPGESLRPPVRHVAFAALFAGGMR